MAKSYELWDFGSGNRLGAYPDRVSALAFVREDIRLGKEGLWREGALLALDDEEHEEMIAEGEGLIALARDDAGQSPPPMTASPALAGAHHSEK